MPSERIYPVDLHTHTTGSDGVLRPSEVVRLAGERGLAVIAITDHDSVSGVDEALEAGKALGIEVVPGVEISVDGGEAEHGRELHILGLFVDHRDPELTSLLRKVAEARVRQKVNQIKRLRELGLQIEVDEVFAIARGVPGRMHIARVLMRRNPGRFRDIQQIFDEFLSHKGKAYVRRDFYLTPAQAIEAIRRAKGIPAIAHPGTYHPPDEAEGFLLRLRKAGIAAAEVSYPYDKTHPYRGYPSEFVEGLIRRLDELAERLHLARTGGSDFHGDDKGIRLGERGLSEEEFHRLRKLAGLD